jgi:exonuclease III
MFVIPCYYTNAQSIVNKLEEFETVINEVKPMIIGITETWGNEDVSEAYLKLDGYQVPYRNDRKDRKGGVCLIVHESLKAVLCEDLTLSNFEESVWCKIDVGNNDTLLVGTVYRSTSSPSHNNEELLNLFEAVEQKRYLTH